MTERAADRRRDAVAAYKRQWLVDAAKAVFARDGIAGASMREIAKTAGYTVGVIYTHFASKEELYAEVLDESLRAVTEAVGAAVDEAPAGSRASAAVHALHRFYAERPSDFDLSFYLFQGAQPVGLDDVLDRRLNALMEEVMARIGTAYVADGAPPERGHHLAVAANSAVFGVVLMAQTGRLRALGEPSDDVLATVLNGVLG